MGVETSVQGVPVGTGPLGGRHGRHGAEGRRPGRQGQDPDAAVPGLRRLRLMPLLRRQNAPRDSGASGRAHKAAHEQRTLRRGVPASGGGRKRDTEVIVSGTPDLPAPENLGTEQLRFLLHYALERGYLDELSRTQQFPQAVVTPARIAWLRLLRLPIHPTV